MARRSRQRPPRETFSRPAVRHGRHGREGRSSVLRPPLRPLNARVELFAMAVSAAADYLIAEFPDELQGVQFGIAGMPSRSSGSGGIDRWSIDRERKSIIMYRVPIQQLIKPVVDTPINRRIVAETCVFDAAAEYLGLDPGDIGPSADY